MITLETAKKALEAAEMKARELNVVVTVAVVDEHGSLIALHKMDGAFYISPKYAIEKAYTSANLTYPTKSLAEYATEGKPYFGMNSMFGGELTTIAGGIPVVVDGKTIGAVGVGGSANTEDDVSCAEAAVAVIAR